MKGNILRCWGLGFFFFFLPRSPPSQLTKACHAIIPIWQALHNFPQHVSGFTSFSSFIFARETAMSQPLLLPPFVKHLPWGGRRQALVRTCVVFVIGGRLTSFDLTFPVLVRNDFAVLTQNWLRSFIRCLWWSKSYFIVLPILSRIASQLLS